MFWILRKFGDGERKNDDQRDEARKGEQPSACAVDA